MALPKNGLSQHFQFNATVDRKTLPGYFICMGEINIFLFLLSYILYFPEFPNSAKFPPPCTFIFVFSVSATGISPGTRRSLASRIHPLGSRTCTGAPWCGNTRGHVLHHRRRQCCLLPPPQSSSSRFCSSSYCHLWFDLIIHKDHRPSASFNQNQH